VRTYRLVMECLFVAGAVACSSSSSSMVAPTTGTLAVSIDAPGGVTPSVVVAGPGGFQVTIHGTQALGGLVAGSYTVVPLADTTPDPIVPTIATGAVTGSPAMVVAGDTSMATVSYATRPGTGALWVANNYPPTLAAFGAAGLAQASATPAATVALSADPISVAIDPNGNLWTTPGNGVISELASGQLAGSGSPTPAVTISVTGVSSAASITFDASGNLWFVDAHDGTIVELAAGQLGVSAAVTPAVTLAAEEPPAGIAFDATGNLWVSSTSGFLIEYASNALTASGTPTPAVELYDASLPSVPAIAFDAAGTLWAVAPATPSLFGFTKTELGASGTVSPALTITPAPSGLSVAQGLAFDASGNLWITAGGGNAIVELAKADLAASGTPVPLAVLSGTALSNPVALAFDPRPAGAISGGAGAAAKPGIAMRTRKCMPRGRWCR
jgi:ligand-binding sensor domain-containing protein